MTVTGARADVLRKFIMKLVFHSYSGAEWGYDIHSGVVKPYKEEATTSHGDSLEEEVFFSPNPFSEDDLDLTWGKGADPFILNVTEQCSNRCRYCVYGGAYGHERVHSQRVMSLETAIKGVEFYCRHHGVATGTVSLSFYGGEPMFEEGMERIKAVLAYVHQHYPTLIVKSSFTTNGNHLTEENCRFLIENDFQILVSLDGPEDIQNRYRVTYAGDPTFATIMKGLQRLHDLSPDYYARRVSFCSVLTPPLEYVRRSAFFREHPLTAGHTMVVSNVSLYNQTLFDEATIQSFTQETIHAINEAARTYYQAAVRGESERYIFEEALFWRELTLLAMHEKNESPNHMLGLLGCCVPGMIKCFVGTDGTIFACEKMQGSYPLGHIDTGVDKEKVLGLIRGFEQLRVERCERCPYAMLCSLCYVNAMDKNHNLSAECLEAACVERRSFFKVALRLYASLKEAGCLPILFTSSVVD